MEVKSIKVDQWSLSELITDVGRGKLRIPQFQRNFVWEKTKVILLLDSMYKDFPVGSFFFWIAPKEYNIFYRNIPELGIKHCDENEEIKFILDGQQRITSLYVCLKGLEIENKDYSEICFDLDKEKFVIRKGDKIRYIPFKDLFGDNHLQIYNDLSDERKKVFDRCRNKFNNYPFSVITVKDKNIEQVCVIFERLNQSGKKLDLFDLVVAKTWDENFKLKDEIEKLNDKFMHSFGKLKNEVFTQSISLIRKKQCNRAYQLRLTKEDIQEVWEDFSVALKKSIDLIRGNFGVKTIDIIPYPSIIPLIVYFYYHSKTMSESQKNKIEEWFWKCSFSERYSGSSLTMMGEDRTIFDKIINEENVEINYPINLAPEKIKKIRITSRSALRNALLCILAKKNPLSFKDNVNIHLDKDYFSTLTSPEKHHIFPKKFLDSQKEKNENSIVNFCFIPSSLNKEVSKKKPSIYFSEYKESNNNFEETLKTHIIPYEKDSGIWNNDYEEFLNKRTELFEKEIRLLVGETTKLEKELDENPNKILNIIENKVRGIIHINLYDSYGENYWSKYIPNDIQEQVDKRIKEILTKQPFLKEEHNQPQKRLEYCDLMDYPKIILKNWKVFEDIFGSKEQLDKYFKNLKEYRNVIAHSKEMSNIVRKDGEVAVEWLLQALDSNKESSEFIEEDEEENELYVRFKEKVESLIENINMDIKKHYIAFKIERRNFLSLAIRNDGIKIWIRGNNFNDPNVMLKDVSEVGHHGTGNYEFFLASLSELDYVMNIVEQAYQQHKELNKEYDVGEITSKIKNNELLDYLERLRKSILEIEKEIKEHITKYRIVFVSNRNFCSIGCRKDFLRISLKINVKPSDYPELDFYEDENEAWDYIKVTTQTPINILLNLIKKSYENSKE